MKIVAPSRSERFVNERGFIDNERIYRFFEQLASEVNKQIFEYKTIDNSDSPYQAVSGERIIADMSSGSVTVTLPDYGTLAVSRDGAANTLTLEGTISGVTDPTTLADGETADMVYYGTEWRYMGRT